MVDRIRAGADLVQVYSAFAYEGPALVGRLKHEVLGIMREQGVESIGDLKGADL